MSRNYVNSFTFQLYQLGDVTDSSFTLWQAQANEYDGIQRHQLKKHGAAVGWTIPVFGVAVTVEDNPQ